MISNLKSLTQKVEKMIAKIEAAENFQTQQKKTAVQIKPARKTAKESKAASTKKAAKKPAKTVPRKSSETKAPEQTSLKVMEIIQFATEGVTTDQIIEQTGLSKRQVWDIVSKAKRAGKIASAKRGIYIASQS